ncbi:branched-chain amino acid ABC transporter permease [Yinghuangia seranimata]|uniref:branched-chain amino acid ABC transporter permease n=1 Tax=Yinghuangia seranimata TaxID=408067 RepID=UPI00248B98DA|nr:branched-chain amino acid ABC transporter permease [Yinghuangia seranimata]MDI2127316.1 branched-chain amino acid ABC transporter permease [Yinghuangia seranimata]
MTETDNAAAPPASSPPVADSALRKTASSGSSPRSDALTAAFDGVRARIGAGARHGDRPPAYRRHQYLAVAVFVAVTALTAPRVVTSAEGSNLLDLWLAYSIAGVGFYWIFGLGGRFAFCQTTMMAVGAYSSAYATGHGRAFWQSTLIGAAAAAIAAAVIGLALARAQHFAFAIGTLAVSQVGVVVFSRTSDFTGVNGQVTGLPYASLFGHTFDSDRSVFWLFLGVLTLVLLLGVFLERSPLGREAVAARDGETVARTAGVPVRRVHLTLYVLGSTAAGISGALLGDWRGFVAVDDFGLDLGIGIFLMVILGGAGSLWGPVLGAGFYVWAPKLLADLDEYKGVVYGALLLVMIMVCPDGLIGLGGRARALVRRRREPAEGGGDA